MLGCEESLGDGEEAFGDEVLDFGGRRERTDQLGRDRREASSGVGVVVVGDGGIGRYRVENVAGTVDVD
jgi:hypothetical protein